MANATRALASSCGVSWVAVAARLSAVKIARPKLQAVQCHASNRGRKNRPWSSSHADLWEEDLGMHSWCLELFQENNRELAAKTVSDSTTVHRNWPMLSLVQM